MASLLERMTKSSVIKGVGLISKSAMFSKDVCPMPIPMINLALSGSLSGGLTSGVTVLAGESKSFKTMLGWLMVAAYQRKHPEGLCVMYDSEFGSPPDYISAMGVDPDRVLHVPVTNIEEMKFDFMQKLEEAKRGDKIIFFMDSLGNLASKKEVDDVMAEKSTADMTRAKQIKSFFRIVTPFFAIKNLPFVCINHIYMTQEMYSKAIVSGGSGVMLSADTVIIMKKVQIKEGTELMGFEFGLFIEKSRYIKEKSRLPLSVTFKNGIDPWSGFFNLALEMGYLKQPPSQKGTPSVGWYSRCTIDKATGELVMEPKKWRRADTDSMTFWTELFEMSDFAQAIERKYRISAESAVKSLSDSEEIIKLMDSYEPVGLTPLVIEEESEDAEV